MKRKFYILSLLSVLFLMNLSIAYSSAKQNVKVNDLGQIEVYNFQKYNSSFVNSYEKTFNEVQAFLWVDSVEATDGYFKARYDMVCRVSDNGGYSLWKNERRTFIFYINAENIDESIVDIVERTETDYLDSSNSHVLPPQYSLRLGNSSMYKEILVSSLEKLSQLIDQKKAEQQQQALMMQDELMSEHSNMLAKYPANISATKKIAIIYDSVPDSILDHKIIDEDIRKIISQKYDGKSTISRDISLINSIRDFGTKYNLSIDIGKFDKTPIINAGIKHGYDYIIYIAAEFDDWSQSGYPPVCRQPITYNFVCFDMKNNKRVETGASKCVAEAQTGGFSGYNIQQLNGKESWIKPKRNALHECFEKFMNNLDSVMK